MAWCRTLGLWAAMMLFIVSSILPAPWQPENCFRSHHRQSEGIGGIQNEVIMLPVFPIMALSGPLFTEMNDGEARGGGVLCRSVGVRVVQALMVPHEMSTICKQFVSQQSLKAGSTCICVCLYIFL